MPRVGLQRCLQYLQPVPTWYDVMCRVVSLLVPVMIVSLTKSQMPGMVGTGTNPVNNVYRWVTTAQKHPTAHTVNYFLNYSKAKCCLLQRLCAPKRKRSQTHKAVKKMMVSHDAGSNKLQRNNRNEVIKVKQFKSVTCHLYLIPHAI